MILHPQVSDQTKVFYDLAIVDNGDGTLTIPAGTCWVDGREYALPAYTPTVGTAPFRLYLKKDGVGADYLLDTLLLDWDMNTDPRSFRPGLGVPRICWRDTPTGEVHVLRSVHA